MIPTNLITGFLGVGKTTAVLDLLKRKNPAEKWAVLVNEYGQVSIDEAFIEGETAPDGVAIRSVAGGCFCCTTAPMLPVALHFLLQDVKIQRLIIETSGMGHPARLIDTIRANYTGRLEVRATLGIVTPSDFVAPGMIDSNPVFRDQVTMSDVLVLNKSETAEPGVIERFQAWANELYPPKLLIAATTQGHLDPAWLDLNSNDERWAHESDHAKPASAKGWIYPADFIFDEDNLLELLGSSPGITRLKGIFRTEDEWIAVNRVGGAITTKATAYRRDSRVEAFGEMDWSVFEKELTNCIIQQHHESGATVSPCHRIDGYPKARRIDSENEPVPRRSRRDDPDDPYDRSVGEDATGGLIPYKNPKALIGYYVSIFGFFLPLIGSVAAVVLGFQGMSFARKNPRAKGTAHAVVAIVLGILGALFWGMVLLGIIVSVAMR